MDPTVVTHVYTIDSSIIYTAAGTVISVLSLTYLFLRNFKMDINCRFDRLEQKFDKRCDRIEEQLNHMDKRICFFEGERFNEEKHQKVK